MKRSLLVIDSAFPYKVIKERSLEDLVMGRDLNEYFDKNPPAREAVQVSVLPKNVNVEISLIAHKL